MSLTHDGLQTRLPPSPVSVLLGVLVTAGAIGTFTQSWWCAGSGLFVLGLLMLLNQVSGVTRVRVTFSKLLLEDERLVMGFLIGPSKRRIPWEEFERVDIEGGQIVAKGRANSLTFGAGQPEAELKEVIRKITDAAQRFREESDVVKPEQPKT